MEIKRHSVNSSNVQSAGFDDKSQTLEITFSNGGKYHYSGVPRVIYEGIFTAESPGRYVRRWIVKGKYKFTKK